MVPTEDPDVKRTQKICGRVLAFMDQHGRVGWFIVALLLLNTALNIADLLHH